MSIRPSYFLIEVAAAGSEAPPKKYFVVHLMEILTSNINDIYNDAVSFRKDSRTVLTGKVLAASTTRSYIEYKKQKWLLEQRRAAIFDARFPRHFLVQYSAGSDANDAGSSVMFAVVPQSLVPWVAQGRRTGPLRLTDVEHPAAILYAHDSDELLTEELQRLKGACNRLAYAEEGRGDTNADASWLLLQYSFRPAHVAYTIASYCETVCREENLRRDLLAYLPHGEDLIQAVILRQSLDRAELQRELLRVAEYGSSVEFPTLAAAATTENAALSKDAAGDGCTILFG